MRLLIVEDHPPLVASLFAYFEARGARLDAAPDGVVGLHLAVTQNYDAVVLDWMLPQVSGLEVLAQLRQRAGWQDTPVLVLSAVDAGDEIARAFAAGASDYVVKPFNPEEFLARLARLLPRTGQGI